MNKSVVIYGPQGCGKTTNSVALAKFFGVNRIVDGGLVPAPAKCGMDTLYLTNQRPEWAEDHDRRVIAFADAMRMATLA